MITGRLLMLRLLIVAGNLELLDEWLLHVWYRKLLDTVSIVLSEKFVSICGTVYNWSQHLKQMRTSYQDDWVCYVYFQGRLWYWWPPVHSVPKLTEFDWSGTHLRFFRSFWYHLWVTSQVHKFRWKKRINQSNRYLPFQTRLKYAEEYSLGYYSVWGRYMVLLSNGTGLPVQYKLILNCI